MKKRIAAIKMQLIISLFLFLIKNRELFFSHRLMTIRLKPTRLNMNTTEINPREEINIF